MSFPILKEAPAALEARELTEIKMRFPKTGKRIFVSKLIQML